MTPTLLACPLTLFLVDDSALIRERLTTLFNAIAGVQVSGSAATPQQALHWLAQHEAQVVVIDLQLREGNGLSVLRGLAASGSTAVPIVLTNHATPWLRTQCLRAGARYFFDKSTDLNPIRDAIRDLAAAATLTAVPEELAMLSPDAARPLPAPPPAPLPQGSAVRCENCATRAICLPRDLSREDFVQIHAMIGAPRKVARGEALYRTGDAFQNIYTIKAGSFKTVVGLRDGREQITGFQLLGEPLGMDGISSEKHLCDAIALEDSILCVIPFHKLEALCYEVKTMQRHVHRWMCGEIARESGQLTLLGSMTAEERVSTFLLNISQRLQARGYSASEFNLRMTREEIGSYLGLKLETVSRMLSRFQKDARIDVQGRLIRILDRAGLQEV